MKFGFVSMPLAGHLNPMTALGRKLQSRGHEVLFLGFPDAEAIVRAAGLNFVSLGEKEYPLGAVPKGYAHISKLHGEEVLRYSVQEAHPKRCQTALEYLPEKLRETGVEAVIIDTIHFFVELAPMSLGIPYIHIWNILNLDRSGATPPCFFNGQHERTPEGRARNVRSLQKFDGFLSGVRATAKSFAEQHGLKIDWNDPSATLSKLAVISQTPKEFDLPDAEWPAQFHYAGPFHDDAGRTEIPFPWEKLDGKPLIYASLGTLLNGSEHLHRAILGAVGKLPEVQVVLSVGKNIRLSDLEPIPPNAIVVPSAPQLELLKRASLCITHAGLNTALEALTQGVPMVAIPVSFDQPGVATRIAYHGVGKFVEVNDVTAERLSGLVQEVLGDPGYREKARYFQKIIAQRHGLDVAADIVERAFGITQTAKAAGDEAELQHAG